MQATVIRPEQALRTIYRRQDARGSSPSADGYAHAARIWNDAVQHNPALVARCLTTDDVQLSLTAVKSDERWKHVTT